MRPDVENTANAQLEGQALANQSNRGKAVIAGIFLLALVLSGYAWWHQFQQSRRCRQFLGTETVKLIRLAPRVDLLRLEPRAAAAGSATQPAGILRIGGATLLIAKRVEITRVPGLLHARHALLQDPNYQWDAPPTDCLSQWSLALRFEQDGEAVIVAFDPHCNRIGLDGTDRTERILPELMRTFADKSVEWETRAGGASPLIRDAAPAAPGR